MRASSTLMDRLPPRFLHNNLKSAEIRALVEDVQAGYSAPANLEKCGSYWRLRVTINNPTGGSVRRCLTIRDEATADWVAEYLKDARARWKDECREQREKKREAKRLEKERAQSVDAAAQG